MPSWRAGCPAWDWRRLFTDWISLTTHALHAARHFSDHHSEGAALNNLGLALTEVRRFEEAITAHQQSASIHRDSGDRHHEDIAMSNPPACQERQNR